MADELGLLQTRAAGHVAPVAGEGGDGDGPDEQPGQRGGAGQEERTG